MRTLSIHVVASLFVILVAQPMSAQESRATIIGRVTDASGAVIGGASVSFTNVGTGVVVKTVTNGEGNYFSSFLIPGTYRVTAEMPGFKNLVCSGITLSVNDRLELNLTLEVGSQAESVTVTADASLLDSANVAVGRVVTAEEVRSLPIHLGDIDNLIRLGNGVAFTDQPAKDQPWQSLNAAYAMAGSHHPIETSLHWTARAIRAMTKRAARSPRRGRRWPMWYRNLRSRPQPSMFPPGRPRVEW